MTEEDIKTSLRTHTAALLERDTVSEKLPKGTDAEVQQLFDFLVSQSFQILSANTVLYQ